MQKQHQYKKEGAAERERRHQFGQPEGNKRGCIPDARVVNQREFYKWVESIATEDELKAYLADETKPYFRKKFIQAYQSTASVQDFVSITNQTHGQPKQQIEVQELPEIHVHAFGED